MEGLYSMGYKQPTPIQEQAIPVILNNKDLIAWIKHAYDQAG